MGEWTGVTGPGSRTHPPRGNTIDWRAQEGQVRRLRQRIFKASQEGDLAEGQEPAEADAAVAGRIRWSACGR